MIQELIFTSAPRGLQIGKSGFCTVASTPGMAENVARLLESLSGYRHVFPPGGAGDRANPVNYSHLITKVGGRELHIISRIADAGLDYSGRSNKIAHHIALDRSELPPGGAAAIIAAKPFVEEWNKGPERLPNRTLAIGKNVPRVCESWARVTGDAGWAGALAESFIFRKQAVVIVRAETPILEMALEALALLPPALQSEVTFSTFFTGLPANVQCLWRFVMADSAEAASAKRNPQNLLIDCTRSLEPCPSEAAECARLGNLVQATSMVSQEPAFDPIALTADVGLADAQLYGMPMPQRRATQSNGDGEYSLAAAKPPKLVSRNRHASHSENRIHGSDKPQPTFNIAKAIAITFLVLGVLAAITTGVVFFVQGDYFTREVSESSSVSGTAAEKAAAKKAAAEKAAVEKAAVEKAAVEKAAAEKAAAEKAAAEKADQQVHDGALDSGSIPAPQLGLNDGGASENGTNSGGSGVTQQLFEATSEVRGEKPIESIPLDISEIDDDLTALFRDRPDNDELGRKLFSPNFDLVSVNQIPKFDLQLIDASEFEIFELLDQPQSSKAISQWEVVQKNGNAKFAVISLARNSENDGQRVSVFLKQHPEFDNEHKAEVERQFGNLVFKLLAETKIKNYETTFPLRPKNQLPRFVEICPEFKDDKRPLQKEESNPTFVEPNVRESLCGEVRAVKSVIRVSVSSVTPSACTAILSIESGDTVKLQVTLEIELEKQVVISRFDPASSDKHFLCYKQEYLNGLAPFLGPSVTPTEISNRITENTNVKGLNNSLFDMCKTRFARFAGEMEKVCSHLRDEHSRKVSEKDNPKLTDDVRASLTSDIQRIESAIRNLDSLKKESEVLRETFGELSKSEEVRHFLESLVIPVSAQPNDVFLTFSDKNFSSDKTGDIRWRRSAELWWRIWKKKVEERARK